MTLTKKPRGRPRAVQPMQEEKMAEPVKALPPAKRPLNLLPSSHYNQTYTVWVPNGTVVEQVLEPAVWSNVAKKLIAADEVKVMPFDMTWRALLIVRARSNLEAVVQVLSYDTLGPAADLTLAGSPYEVKFVNADRKWGVFRVGGGDMLRDEFQTREDAERYARNHTKLIAA